MFHTCCRPSTSGAIVKACSSEDAPPRQQDQQKHRLPPRLGSGAQGGARPLTSQDALHCLHPLPGPSSDQLLAQLRRSLASPLGSVLHTRTVTPRTEYRTHFSRGGDQSAPGVTPAANAAQHSQRPVSSTGACQGHLSRTPIHSSAASQLSAARTSGSVTAIVPGVADAFSAMGSTKSQPRPGTGSHKCAPASAWPPTPSGPFGTSHLPPKSSQGSVRPASAHNPITHSLGISSTGPLQSLQHINQAHTPLTSTAPLPPASYHTLASIPAAQAAPSRPGSATRGARPRLNSSPSDHHHIHQPWQRPPAWPASTPRRAAVTASSSQQVRPPSPYARRAAASPAMHPALQLQPSQASKVAAPAQSSSFSASEQHNQRPPAVTEPGQRQTQAVTRPATSASTWSTDAIALGGYVEDAAGATAQLASSCIEASHVPDPEMLRPQLQVHRPYVA
jgi:hypothetical protein